MNQEPLIAYIALTSIDHNGENLKSGAPLNLTAKQAESLRAANAIELATADSAGHAAVLNVPELGEVSRLNEILDSVEGRLQASQALNIELQAQNESLAGQVESAQTAKASAQSEVAELQVKLNATLEALQESQAALQEAQTAAAAVAAAKGAKKS